MKECLYSAPNEKYSDHIKLCLEKFGILYPLFESSILRVFRLNNKGAVREAFKKMITYHDLGKLTERWQENIGTGKKLPSHATLGAAYLWQILPAELKEPISFSVAIHHTDRGLLGDNIEKPDVQAITDNIADYSGKIKWFNEDERESLSKEFFPQQLKGFTINELKEMARGLRRWAKGCSIQDQHKRRMQASLCHHLLKLCDISAASGRKEWEDERIEKGSLYGGWLMVQNIVEYTNQITERMK